MIHVQPQRSRWRVRTHFVFSFSCLVPPARAGYDQQWNPFADFEASAVFDTGLVR